MIPYLTDKALSALPNQDIIPKSPSQYVVELELKINSQLLYNSHHYYIYIENDYTFLFNFICWLS